MICYKIDTMLLINFHKVDTKLLECYEVAMVQC